MSDHDEASAESRELCDALFEGLQRQIPDLRRNPTKRWCGFYEVGRNRFAYVNHRRVAVSVKVWCLGDAADLVDIPGLSIELRTPTQSGWSNFGTKFAINDASAIPAAVEFLHHESYPLS
jgi:hypothetical protein